MSKKCPVGLICVDTKYLLIFFLLIITLLRYNIFFLQKNSNKAPFSLPKSKIEKPIFRKQEQIIKEEPRIIIKNIERPNPTNYLINKDYERVINPLLPPERRNNYIEPNSQFGVGVPVNIPTRGFGGDVQQIGMLTKQDGNNPVVLPLFGCPTFANSNKWMYYTSSDKYNQIKIPLSNKNRQCDSEYGCEEIYDGDSIDVYPYEGSFKVSIYKYDKPRYLPHII